MPTMWYTIFLPINNQAFFGQTLIKIEREPLNNGFDNVPDDAGDYHIYIESSCTFYYYYLHPNKLAQRIIDEMGSDLSGEEWRYVRIPVSSGEVIAYTGGGVNIAFGVVDRDRENS